MGFIVHLPVSHTPVPDKNTSIQYIVLTLSLKVIDYLDLWTCLHILGMEIELNLLTSWHIIMSLDSRTVHDMNHILIMHCRVEF